MHHHPWKMWPLWVGVLIAIASPLVAATLHILFLPCILFQKARETRQRRAAQAAVQMEEGRRANAAACLATKSIEPELLARSEESHQTDGIGMGTGASPPAVDTEVNDLSASDYSVHEGGPPTVSVEESEMIETPAAVPSGKDATRAISAPLAPAHVGCSPPLASLKRQAHAAVQCEQA